MVAGPDPGEAVVFMTDVADRIGNVARQRDEQLVTRAKELIAQITRAQFALGDMALEIEPMRSVGGSTPNGTEDLFTVTEALQLFADDIGVEQRTVEDWRYAANRWPEGRRKEGVSFTVHRILASVAGEEERWAAIEERRSTRALARGSGRRTARSGSSASWSTGRSRWMRRYRLWPT